MVSATSRMVSAISFGVLLRLAPSTIAIMRSRKASPGIGCNANDDPVGQHARAAGDRRKVAAGFADHRRGFAGDRGFVDRRHAFDHLAIGRNRVAGLDQHDTCPRRARRLAPDAMCCRVSVRSSTLADTRCLVARNASACALPRPSASASAALANSTVNHSQNAMAKMKPADASACAAQRLNPQQRGHDAAEVHDEHHRVLPLDLRSQLLEGLGDNGWPRLDASLTRRHERQKYQLGT